MCDILMLLAQNDIDTDPRVSKAFNAAMEHGYNVKVCCYQRYEETTSTPYIDRIRMLFSRNVNAYKKSKELYIKKDGSFQKHRSTTIMVVASSLIMFSLHQVDLFLKSKKYKPKIVHANDLNTLLTGILHKKINGSKLIYDSHELWVDMMYIHPLYVRKMLTWYERILLKYVDEVITVNSAIAEEFSKRYGIVKPHVVMNVPYLETVEQPEHEGIRVIYQGKYDSGRYLENVVRGAKYFDKGITLTMRGIGEYGETLKKCIQSNNVEFVPPVPMDKLVQSLKGFDIGVATGAHKQGKNGEFASPNKLFEYMMAGCAVVGNDSPIIGKIVLNCESGSLFDGNNPRDFALVINHIAGNQDMMKGMKESGIKNVREKYCWESEQKNLIEVYRLCEQ